MPISDAGRRRLSEACRKRKPRLGKVVSPVFVRDGVPGKACRHCLEWKPLPKFARHATCAGGRRNICSTCEGRQAYANRRDRVISAVRAYQKRNPEASRERKRAGERRRHGRKIASSGIPIREYRAIFTIYGGMCAYCLIAKADTLDHVVPLCKGGDHDITNVVPACRKCNFKKHTRTDWVPHPPKQGSR